MLGEAAQVADIASAVLVPAALLIAAAQTRLLRQQVKAEVTARHMQVYQALHEDMAERVRVFLDYPAYRPAFYENQPLADGLDPALAETLAEMFLDLMDTVAVQASALPEEWAETWVGVCRSDYGCSPVIRAYWARVHQDYGPALRGLLPTPSATTSGEDGTAPRSSPPLEVGPTEQTTGGGPSPDGR